MSLVRPRRRRYMSGFLLELLGLRFGNIGHGLSFRKVHFGNKSLSCSGVEAMRFLNPDGNNQFEKSETFLLMSNFLSEVRPRRRKSINKTGYLIVLRKNSSIGSNLKEEFFKGMELRVMGLESSILNL